MPGASHGRLAIAPRAARPEHLFAASRLHLLAGRPLLAAPCFSSRAPRPCPCRTQRQAPISLTCGLLLALPSPARCHPSLARPSLSSFQSGKAPEPRPLPGPIVPCHQPHRRPSPSASSSPALGLLPELMLSSSMAPASPAGPRRRLLRIEPGSGVLPAPGPPRPLPPPPLVATTRSSTRSPEPRCQAPCRTPASCASIQQLERSPVTSRGRALQVP
ncbi:hypothetical protein VPH35_072212 [Triticum aestivum]